MKPILVPASSTSPSPDHLDTTLHMGVVIATKPGYALIKCAVSRERLRQLSKSAQGICESGACQNPVSKCGRCAEHYERNAARARNRYRLAAGIPLDAAPYQWTKGRRPREN